MKQGFDTIYSKVISSQLLMSTQEVRLFKNGEGHQLEEASGDLLNYLASTSILYPFSLRLSNLTK
ncbi:unnamed protein product [Dovyalis caffra]|uniref:Uncharacterized protein n=1 Tax=Dovyalis caffra TaxID=77055 RepID=A0AAV1RI02_9ROSI|nr:unnamed protein product [Dovyalis caffra]